MEKSLKTLNSKVLDIHHNNFLTTTKHQISLFIVEISKFVKI